MSLNNILLNNQLLCQLYAHSLLETKAAPRTDKQEPPIAAAVREAEKQAAPNNAPNTTALSSEAGTTPKAGTAPEQANRVKEPVVTYGDTPSLGANKKGILILVSNNLVPFLPDGELEFLSTILSACRLSIADVAIVNLHKYPQPYTSLLQQFNSRQILLLGITPQALDLPFHFPHFQLQNFDGRTYLSASSLGDIAGSRDLKMQLWSCLKTMFGI